MKTWHAFADPKAPPRIGIGANDPPVTGGVVFDTFEHDGGTHQDRLRIAEERSSPLRVERLERGSWQTYGEKFPANGSGYDEALMFMRAIARAGGEVRLVTRNGTVLPPTSGTGSTFAPPPLPPMPTTSFPHSVPGPQRHPHLYESVSVEPPGTSGSMLIGPPIAIPPPAPPAPNIDPDPVVVVCTGCGNPLPSTEHTAKLLTTPPCPICIPPRFVDGHPVLGDLEHEEVPPESGVWRRFNPDEGE